MSMSNKLIVAGFDGKTAVRMESEILNQLGEAKRELADARIKAEFWAATVTRWSAEVQRLEGTLK